MKKIYKRILTIITIESDNYKNKVSINKMVYIKNL